MSEVWQVFDKSMCGQRAICSICNKSYANSLLRRSLSITNVSSINPQEDANIDLDGPSTSKLVLKQTLLPTTKKGNVISNQSLMSSFTLTKASQTKIDAALAYFIAVDMMPYNIVAKEGFKLYTKSLNSSYNIPSRKTITDSKIPKLKYDLGSICLGCVELSEDHTGENIADTLELLLLDYNLSVPSNNVCAFTTDYGANILKAINNLRVPHVTCFNTAVGLGLSSFLKTYKKGHYKKLILSDEEIDVLKCITTVLNPVREITDHLAGENYVTASAIYPVIFNLKTKLSEAVNANNNDNASDNMCREIKTKIFSCIITVLDKRYDNNTVLQISMVLDPRFKTTFVALEEVAEVKQNIIEKRLESWTEWSTNTRTGRTSDAANSVLPLDIPNQLTHKKKRLGSLPFLMNPSTTKMMKKLNGDRSGLGVSTGHYKSIVWRDNDRWEVYDDLKETATNPYGKKHNVEFLIYTI
ncbi:unnamed protein product [Macrosiphum euphorbiae]|uniref:Transposase n=1 Tax=Macrosiphum euphorbiae TaxID=13131 RepID=A0AAV0XGL5_9HEMI|nr:unnamed protein product [Macrosiphum euphorbiae]